MCLAIPMRVLELEGFVARCDAKGIERSVSLLLLQHEDVRPGDHLLVHVGYAIQKLSASEAGSVWELLDQMLSAEPEVHGHA